MKKILILFSYVVVLISSFLTLSISTLSSQPDSNLHITHTNIRADEVFNTGGYGSIHINAVYCDDGKTPKENPASALINPCGEYVMPYEKTQLCYYYDSESGIISLADFDDSEVCSFFEGFSAVKSPDNNKYGFIDKNGDMVISFIFDRITAFENGTAYAIKDGKIVIISSNDKGRESVRLIDGEYRYYNEYGIFTDKNGSVQIDGSTYYFCDGIAKTDCVLFVNEKYLYFGSDGKFSEVNGYKKVGDYWYYFKNGEALTNTVVKERTYLRCFDENGRFSPVNGYKKVGNYYYYFKDGKAVANAVVKERIFLRYFDKNGRFSPINGYKKVGSYYYYFASGVAKQNCILHLSQKYQYADKNGRLSPINGYKKVKEYWYFFRDGKPLKNTVVKERSFLRYFNAKGRFSPINGYKKVGDYYYYFTNGLAKSNTVILLSGKYRYFDSNGRFSPKNGYTRVNKYYYYLENGIAKTNAVMKERCFFRYFGNNGRFTAYNGYKKVGRYAYYFVKGVARKNCILRLSGKYRYFDSNGRFSPINGYKTDGKKYYYFVNGCAKTAYNMKHLTDTVQRYAIGVKNIWQNPELPNGCEIVSLAIVLNYLGYDVNPVWLSDNYLEKGIYHVDSPYRKYIGDPKTHNGCGCYAPCIVKSADRFLENKKSQFRAVNVSGSSLSKLEKYVDAGIPVIIWGTVNMNCSSSVCFSYSTDADGYVKWYMSSHCLVLIGHTASAYIFADPLRGIVEYSRSAVLTSYYQEYMQSCVIV